MNKVNDFIEHIKINDPQLFLAYIEHKVKIEPMSRRIKPDSYFLQLCKDVIGQQLAIKAADAIIGRFKALFEDGEVTPEKIISIDDAELRSVGLSRAKIKAIKDLSAKVINLEIDFLSFDKKSDLEILNDLVQVWGIGSWTAEMFLIFTLSREDVFSKKDLGLKKGIEKVYKINIQDQTEGVLDTLMENWKPYRSYAALLLWSIHDRTK